MNKNYFLAKLFALLLTSSVSSLSNAQTYCNPTYNSACTTWRITQVTIPQASFDNTFASGTCITGRNRTSTVINLNSNTPYTINITTTGWLGCGMAIDFNNDGDFEDTNEKLYMPLYEAVNPKTYSGTFTIPTSVVSGNYRMRVWNRVANSGDGTPADSACGTYNYGTWTDYTVNISSLSTSEVTKVSAKVYPNPVSDVLHIDNKENIKSIEIFDYNGRLIKTVAGGKNTSSVSLSELNSGNYTAKVNTDKNSQVIKFIKK